MAEHADGFSHAPTLLFGVLLAWIATLRRCFIVSLLFLDTEVAIFITQASFNRFSNAPWESV